MRTVQEASESTSDLMRKLADCQYEIWCDDKTFEPFIVDPKTKTYYNMTEEVSHWREYIYDYRTNRASWLLKYHPNGLE